MKKLITTILILILATIVCAETYTVEHVIDGNTIELTNGEKIRLIGVECPYLPPGCRLDDLECEQQVKQAIQASKFVKNVIEAGGSKVRLEFDDKKRDEFDQLLAYVYVPFLRGKFPPSDVLVDDDEYIVFLNAYLVREGYATPMINSSNNKYNSLFKKLYKEAKEQKRGLWKEDSIFPTLEGNIWTDREVKDYWDDKKL